MMGTALVALSLAASCGKTEITAEKTGATGGAGGSVGPDAAADAGPGVCPAGLPGAKLVRVPAANGTFYCIDQREVTNGEYKQFVEAAAKVPPSQPAECSWNESFLPEILQPGADEEGSGKCYAPYWKYDTEPSYPVICVDFCDAWAFCKWAGKRLCGVVGAGAAKPSLLPNADVDTLAVSTSSEWFNACSQGGTSKYPYGDEYVPGRCIDEAKLASQGPSARVISDTSQSGCHGTSSPWDEVFDLSGSVDEWQNICRTSGCVIQGGAVAGNSSPADLVCAEGMGIKSIVSIHGYTGFRCCADTVAETDTGGL